MIDADGRIVRTDPGERVLRRLVQPQHVVEREADVELVGEAHRPAGSDVERAIADAIVDVEGRGRVDAI